MAANDFNLVDGNGLTVSNTTHPLYFPKIATASRIISYHEPPRAVLVRNRLLVKKMIVGKSQWMSMGLERLCKCRPEWAFGSVAVGKSQRMSMGFRHLSQCRFEWTFGGVAVDKSQWVSTGLKRSHQGRLQWVNGVA